MKNFKINPAAKNIDARITCTWEDLEAKGWDFDGISGKENYKPIIRLRTLEEGGKIHTDWYMNGLTNNEVSASEYTGDDEATLNNVIELLEEGKISETDIDDDSTGVDGHGWVKTFIQYDIFREIEDIEEGIAQMDASAKRSPNPNAGTSEAFWKQRNVLSSYLGELMKKI